MAKYASAENKRRLGMQDEMPKIIVFLCLFSLEMSTQWSIQRKLDTIRDITGHDILVRAMWPQTGCMFLDISYSPSHLHGTAIH